MENPLSFHANDQQSTALRGLAYWIADVHYIAERFGKNDPEHEKAHKNVIACFDDLDRLGVPFWVQNHVIIWAEDWRRYKTEYIKTAMEKRGITLA